MRVATVNLCHGLSWRSGRIDLAAHADAIAALDADVVGLQEVDRGLRRSGGRDQVADLAATLGMHGVFVPALLGDPERHWTTVSGADPGSGAYGVGLLTRTPVAGVERAALPGGGPGRRRGTATPGNPGWDREPRAALLAELLPFPTAPPLAVAVTHLSYLPWRGMRQLRGLCATLDRRGRGAAVLLGDLNLPPRLVRLAATGGWVVTDASATYPADDPRMQLDHVLHRAVSATDARVTDRDVSDHRCLVVELTLPDAHGAHGAHDA